MTFGPKKPGNQSKPRADRFPERRGNQGQAEPSAPTHEVTALNLKTGAKGTIGAAWLRTGEHGTYLTIRLMPFVNLAATEDVMINVFERDHGEVRMAKEMALNAMPAPAEEYLAQRAEEREQPGDEDQMYRQYVQRCKDAGSRPLALSSWIIAKCPSAPIDPPADPAPAGDGIPF